VPKGPFFADDLVLQNPIGPLLNKLPDRFRKKNVRLGLSPGGVFKANFHGAGGGRADKAKPTVFVGVGLQLGIHIGEETGRRRPRDFERNANLRRRNRGRIEPDMRPIESD
jgi:hypothetical protein